MGRAVWLYMWLVQHQTKRHGGVFVLGGMPLTYREIERRSKWKERTIRLWLDRLREKRYIKVHYLNYMMMRIEITKAKKWNPKQTQMHYPTVDADTSRAKKVPVAAKVSTGTDFPVDANMSTEAHECVNGSTQRCQPKQNCSLKHRKAYTKAEAEAVRAVEITEPNPAAAAAFISLGFEQPFGNTEFQNAWTDEYARMGNGSFTDAMERTAAKCQTLKIPVPKLFYTTKRRVEDVETEGKWRRVPL